MISSQASAKVETDTEATCIGAFTMDERFNDDWFFGGLPPLLG
jgi:hypothetical protein